MLIWARLCKGAMLSFLHEPAPSLVFFEVLKSYNKPILRRASCGNKTTTVVILIKPPIDQIKASLWLNLYLKPAQLLILIIYHQASLPADHFGDDCPHYNHLLPNLRENR
jgi:hypothetical protein